VVPVLPYTSGRLSVLCARAAVPERVTSCSKLVMTKALRGSMARCASSSARGLLSASTLPRCSLICVISQGLTR